MKSRNLLIVAFFIIFMFLGITTLKESMPSPKNDRIYSMLQEQIPYVIEKRAGGLSIKSKITGVKEKPPAKQIFLRLEQLEQQWGKEYLKIKGNNLIVLNEEKKEVKNILLKNAEEINWVKDYFGIK